MNNEKIEKMLYDAQENLPTTNVEWKLSDMAEKRTEKNRFQTYKVVAACVAFVMCLGIGGGTVLANMEMDIDSNNYSQWVDVRSEGNWNACEKLMEKRGFAILENFGDYKYEKFRTLLVAKKGDTYLDALTKNVYNPIDIEYDDDNDDGQWISISVGSLEEFYWHAYYEFEKADEVWVYSDAETAFNYRGITVYGKHKYYETSEKMNWRWVDKENGLCWSVHVPVHTGMDSELDSQEVVKEIITLNTTFWTDQVVNIQEESELFEGFSLADYKTETEVHPVISNEDLYVIFYEESLEITLNDTQEVFSISVPYYIRSGLYNARTSSTWLDINQDGVEELIFSSYEGGTCRISYVDVIDIENKCSIPLEYDVQELADAFMTMTESESYVLNTSSQDEKRFTENGTIHVATAYGVLIEGSHTPEYVGEIVGTLVYDAGQKAYVLDEDSIYLKWYE